MEHWELVARERIRQMLADYNWCGDFGDADGFADQFATDSVLDVKGRETLFGQQQIRDAAKNAFWLPADVIARRRAGGPFHHHVSSVRISIDDPDTARVWAYFLVLGKQGPDHWGRYTDRVRRDGERWLLVHRRVSIDGASTDSTHQAAPTVA